MDELTQAMMVRAGAVPSDPAKVPPREQRFATAQKMISGYQNNWSPNPLLVRIMEGSR